MLGRLRRPRENTYGSPRRQDAGSAPYASVGVPPSRETTPAAGPLLTFKTSNVAGAVAGDTHELGLRQGASYHHFLNQAVFLNRYPPHSKIALQNVSAPLGLRCGMRLGRVRFASG